MKSKAPLALMEQLVMLLVFALAAALCLRMFAAAGRISRQCEAQAQAVTHVQNTAETVKFCRGDFQEAARLLAGSGQEEKLQILYDSRWQEISGGQAAYRILAEQRQTDIPLLGMAEITAEQQDGTLLFRVTAAWQEETDG